MKRHEYEFIVPKNGSYMVADFVPDECWLEIDKSNKVKVRAAKKPRKRGSYKRRDLRADS